MDGIAAEKRNMSGITKGATVALACVLGVGLLLTLSGCTLWTVRSLNPAEGEAPVGSAVPGEPGFTAQAYVDEIWESQVLPAAENDSTELGALLEALNSMGTARASGRTTSW
jgi:hypothetical protein